MNRRKGGQPNIIAGDGFTGEAGLSLEDWKDLSVTTAVDAPRAILDNWEGKILGYCSVELNNDNTAILNAKFNLAGSLWDQRAPAISAHRFWQGLENGTTLHFPTVNSNVFVFNSGTLVSDLVGHQQIEHVWQRDNAPIQLSHGFCLRAFVAPTEELWASLWVILYPLAKEELLTAHPQAADPRFPGLEVTCVHFRLGIVASTFLNGASWGSPLLPVVIPGASWDTHNVPPAAASLKKAIADTLRTAARPEIKKNHSTLAPRWNEINEAGPTSLKALPPYEIWPEASAPPPQRGSFFSSFFTL